MEALNLTVGRLYLQSPLSERTVLSRALQHGEAPPGSPAIKAIRVQKELPPEGFVDETPKGSTPAAEKVRATAFAEPT
jgi:hypothetical protein